MSFSEQEYQTMKARLDKKHQKASISLPIDQGGAFDVDLTIRPSTDEQRLNKTERAYLAYLRMLRFDPIGIQNITLKLADDCRLTPDFNYPNANSRFIFVDVKGFQREDAFLKMKFAARIYRWADFVIVKRDGTGWKVTEVKP